MKTYTLVRNEDETGNSGTGPVAKAVEFDDGTAVLKWDGRTNALGVSSMVVYQSIEDLVKVHGHGGKTVLVPDSDMAKVDAFREELRELPEFRALDAAMGGNKLRKCGHRVGRIILLRQAAALLAVLFEDLEKLPEGFTGRLRAAGSGVSVEDLLDGGPEAP